MACGGSNELSLPSRQQKLFKIPATVLYSIILIKTAVQPKRRNSGWCSTFKDTRIYDLMTGASSAKSSAIAPVR
jgi:hypothetical protein